MCFMIIIHQEEGWLFVIQIFYNTPYNCSSLKIAFTSLHQGAFPARLKKVLIVGAPVWFRVPYSLLSLLLKEKLRERVSCGACFSFFNTLCLWYLGFETLLGMSISRQLPLTVFTLHGFECSSYEPYPGFDHIWDVTLTYTQRNLVIHVAVDIINWPKLVSDYLLKLLMFIVFKTQTGEMFKSQQIKTIFRFANTIVTFTAKIQLKVCVFPTTTLCKRVLRPSWFIGHNLSE